MAEQKIKGDLIGLNVNGVDIACETSSDFSFEVDMRAASAIKSGRWKEVIPGIRSWQMSVNANLLLASAGAGATDILNAVLTGEIMVLRFKTRDSIVPEFIIVGEAYVSNGSVSASVGTNANWNATFTGSGPFSIGDASLYATQYGYRAVDPFGDEVNLEPQFVKRFPVGSPEISFDFTKASAGFFLFAILPVGQPNFNIWENSQFNFGNLPDYAWREPYIYGGNVIITSRSPLYITSEISVITFKYKNLIPGPFYFQDVVNATRNTLYLSNIITVTQVTEPVNVIATGGYVKINGGAQVTQGFAGLNDTVQAVNTSSLDYNTATGTVVTIGGITDTYDVQTQPDATLYYAFRSGTFTRNNCGSGFVGSSITFSKTYTSAISQIDADNMAAADSNFSTDGQNYANANGNCVLPSYYVWGRIEYENLEEYQDLIWADVYIYAYKGTSPTVPPSFIPENTVNVTVYDIPIQFTFSGSGSPGVVDSNVSMVNEFKTRIVHPDPGALYPKVVVDSATGADIYRVLFTGLSFGAPKMIKQVSP
jgi:predicted secreted protein